MELYKLIDATREILKDNYDDLRSAEDKAIEIQVKVRYFLYTDEAASEKTGEVVYQARNVVIEDLEKFFSGPLEPSVPGPF
jgi:hypothetical protein